MAPKHEKLCAFAVQRPVRGIRLKRFSPWGLCVHQTGRGIVEKARAKKVDPVEIAAKYYQSGWKAHYLIGYDGRVFQFIADTVPGAHIGVSPSEREKYVSGKWAANFLGTPVLALWRERWGEYLSPQHLFPGKSANQTYLGVELLPLYVPTGEGLWFTDDQHQAVVDLAKDRALAHGWPAGWENTPRLVGHEDVDAYGRWQPDGGWDPGALREKPRFDWPRVKEGIANV